jgi:RNA polymerase sigma-70 factor (ECF subfamily)
VKKSAAAVIHDHLDLPSPRPGAAVGQRRLRPVIAFETAVLPHLGAARSLAWQIVRNQADAEDVSQEAVARAFRFFDGLAGGHPRGWLLKIVRNTAYQFLRNRARELTAGFDEVLHADPAAPVDPPAGMMLRSIQRRLLNQAIEALPIAFREALVLREGQGFSYKEIADTLGIPMGTVMSRLSRARWHLRAAL